MEARTIEQNGVTPIYIEKNNGSIFVRSAYVEEVTSAFKKGSYELQDYTPPYNQSFTEKR